MEEEKITPPHPEDHGPEHKHDHRPDKHKECRCGCGDHDGDCCSKHHKIKKCVWALLFFLAGYVFAQMWNCCCCKAHHAKYHNLIEHAAKMKTASYPNDIGGGIIIINTEGTPNVDHFTGRYHPHMAKKSARGHQPDMTENAPTTPASQPVGTMNNAE